MEVPATVWTSHEDDLLRSAVQHHGIRRWDFVAASVPDRSEDACSTRWGELQTRSPIATRQPWSADEDELLSTLVSYQGASQWTIVASFLPGRTAKQCRERWRNQLDPSIKHGPWSANEDELLVSLQQEMGNAWARIASHLPGRTDNAAKNRWHSAQLRNLKCGQKTENGANKVSPLPLEIQDEGADTSTSGLPMVTAVVSEQELTWCSEVSSEDLGLWIELAECLLDSGNHTGLYELQPSL